jgi:hypothetical protein
MSNQDQHEDTELIDEFRQAMHYPDHGAAQKLRRVLAKEGAHSRVDRAAWLPFLALRRARWPRTQGRRLSILAVLVLMASGVALAATNITNLGKPTDIQSTASYFPLSGFHISAVGFAHHKRPELLLLVDVGYYPANIEGWPIVKALSQFGTLVGVKPLDLQCRRVAGPRGSATACTAPTFDLSHITFRSRYVTVVEKRLIVFDGKHTRYPAQHFTPEERAIFERYVHARPNSGWAGGIKLGQLPLIAVDHYVQTSSQVMNVSDFTNSVATTSPSYGNGQYSFLPFAVIHSALISGKDPAGTHVVEDVNAEANIITALICHADGMQPTKVCSRPVIKTILKHVK